MTPPWAQKSRTPKSGGRGAGSRNVQPNQVDGRVGPAIHTTSRDIHSHLSTREQWGNTMPSAVTHHHSLVSRAGLGPSVGGGLVWSTSCRGLGQLPTGPRDCDCRGYTNMVIAAAAANPETVGSLANLFLANLGGSFEVPPAAVSRTPPPSATPLLAPCGEMRPRLHRCRWSR